MPTGDEYRIKAAEMSDRARREANPVVRAEYDNLAMSYLRLADQADRNARSDIVYETPPVRDSVQQPQPQQQQQQQQPKPDEKK